MANPRRQRQKALRRAKLARLEKARRRRRYLQRGGLGAAVIIVVVGLLYVFNRHPGTTATPAKHATTTSAGCPAANGSSPRRTSFTQAPPLCINPHRTYVATVRTDVGTFRITLDKQDPRVVNDFVYLARYHYYRGLTFHRVIPGFVVQGGDLNPPTRSHPNPSGPQTPGFTVPGKPPARNSAYQVGTVAMAKTASERPGTAGAQFFVVLSKKGAQALGTDYAILGQVTSGMKVVDKIAAGGSASGYPRVTHRMLSVTISP